MCPFLDFSVGDNRSQTSTPLPTWSSPLVFQSPVLSLTNRRPLTLDSLVQRLLIPTISMQDSLVLLSFPPYSTIFPATIEYRH